MKYVSKDINTVYIYMYIYIHVYISKDIYIYFFGHVFLPVNFYEVSALFQLGLKDYKEVVHSKIT